MTDKPCPNCGYCPACGQARSVYPVYGYVCASCRGWVPNGVLHFCSFGRMLPIISNTFTTGNTFTPYSGGS